MTQYRRSRVPGGKYFFTVNLYDRRSRLVAEQIDALWVAVAQVKARMKFDIDAWVFCRSICIVFERCQRGDADFSLRWREIKSAFSRRVPRGEARSASREGKAERAIWQRRFWEHRIRDERDFCHAR